MHLVIGKLPAFDPPQICFVSYHGFLRGPSISWNNWWKTPGDMFLIWDITTVSFSADVKIWSDRCVSEYHIEFANYFFDVTKWNKLHIFASLRDVRRPPGDFTKKVQPVQPFSGHVAEHHWISAALWVVSLVEVIHWNPGWTLIWRRNVTAFEPEKKTRRWSELSLQLGSWLVAL